MRTLGLIVLAMSLALSTCAPSAQAVQTAIAQTQNVQSIPTFRLGPTPAPPTSTAQPNQIPQWAFTPYPTLTPRPSDTSGQGTMTRPYPFRQTISLTRTNAKGERIAVYELQVLNLLRGETVNSIVNGSNRFNKAPSLGSEYAMIKVGLTLLQGRLRLSDADFVVESNGQLFDAFHPSVCCTDEYGYPKLDANLIMPGATSEGWIIRFVFKKDPDPLLVMNLTGDRPVSEGLFFATTP